MFTRNLPSLGQEKKKDYGDYQPQQENNSKDYNPYAAAYTPPAPPSVSQPRPTYSEPAHTISDFDPYERNPQQTRRKPMTPTEMCVRRAAGGFQVGAVIGVTFGFIFGSFGGYQAGLRGTKLIVNVGKTSAQAGLAFGFFLTIGSVIRGCG